MRARKRTYAYLDIKKMNQDLGDMPVPLNSKEDGVELASTRNPIGNVSWPEGRPEERLPITFPEGEGDEY